MPTSRDVPLTAAQQRLATDHFRLARRLARQWGGIWPALRDEFESAACLGLVLAARQFKPALGMPFDLYACYRIRGTMKTVWSKHRLHRAWRGTGTDVDLESLIDPRRPVDADFDDADAVAGLLRRIPRREAVLLRLVDLEGRTMQATGARIGRPRSWVHRHRKQALAELRAVAEGRC